MNWLEKPNGNCFAAPYRVVRGSDGWWSAWIFSSTQSGALGKQIASKDKAQKLCEAHQDAQSRENR